MSTCGLKDKNAWDTTLGIGWSSCIATTMSWLGVGEKCLQVSMWATEGTESICHFLMSKSIRVRQSCGGDREPIARSLFVCTVHGIHWVCKNELQCMFAWCGHCNVRLPPLSQIAYILGMQRWIAMHDSHGWCWKIMNTCWACNGELQCINSDWWCSCHLNKNLDFQCRHGARDLEPLIMNLPRWIAMLNYEIVNQPYW